MDPMNGHSQPAQASNAHDVSVAAMSQQQGTATALSSVGTAQLLPNQQAQVHPHLMGLMTNPALAAAAAASSLFPPAAMLSNPGAYLAMPDAFQVAGGIASAPTIAGANNAAAVAGMGGVVPGNVLQTMGMQIQNPMIPNTFDEIKNGGQAVQVVASATAPQQIAPIAALTSFHNPALTLPQLAPAPSTEPDSGVVSDRARRADLTPAERAKQHRDRNREHARSTRLRKKAYVQKLKELVEGLHAEQTEEVRQRRVAIQHLAEMQNIRRAVVTNFLKFHSNYETDDRKWRTILEDDFWLKQPVTPYRSFRRAEIEQECRMSRGVEAIVNDSASLSVMIESIGWKSPRWMKIKREGFLELEQAKRGSKERPRCIVRQDGRLHHAISSLSNSSSASSSEEQDQKKQKLGLGLGTTTQTDKQDSTSGSNADDKGAAKVSSSSGSGGSSSGGSSDRAEKNASKDFHDYHAKPLPDPKLGDSERSSQSGEDDSSDGENNKKRISTDSSVSGDDSAAAIAAPRKRRKVDNQTTTPAEQQPTTAGMAAYAARVSQPNLPPNIAKKGGIPHNIRPVANGAARLSLAPAVALPSFSGIGKRNGPGSSPSAPSSKTGHDPALNVISADPETSSTSSASNRPQIRGYYHVNEDDMILMDDVIMCPFVFRSQDAVMCGALAECVMPGMLRATFTAQNKLASCELVYDSMGMMQMLERASGNEGSAQIIPGSLEMALAPSTTEARVITLAEPPFLIVNVNEVWTRTTGYTQMEVEGKEYLTLLGGEGTVPEAYTRSGKPKHLLEEVAKGHCACSTNIHYDSKGRDFIEFVCSYPLTNGNDEVSHLLHVSKELPSLTESSN